MAINEVLSAGVHVGIDGRTGYYFVTTWYHLEAGRMQDVRYEELTWSEAQDCVQFFLVDHRPGWQMGDGWAQPAIDFGDDVDR